MRRKIGDLKRAIQDETFEAFFLAVRHAEKKGEIVSLLKNILTESEQLMLGRRMLVAKLLLSGLSHAEIRERLRLSPNTIWQINRWLRGQIPEYGLAEKQLRIERRKNSKKSNVDTFEKIQNFSFKHLKKKYPLHFLLFTIADEIKKKHINS